MNILVTGHQGYIGSHLTRLLKESGHHIIGCDLRLFQECEWKELPEANICLQKDFRELTKLDLEGVDAICHLAGISNDPMGELDSNITKEVNQSGTIELAKIAKLAGVKRFLFSSSCSIYGTSNQGAIKENGKLNPISAYAESKINAEIELSKLAEDDFSPVFLRNATAYGDSPCFRIDLVINNLIASGVLNNHINVLSDGTPWRPYIHCEDIARAFKAILESPIKTTHNVAINVGDNFENFQVKEIAHHVQNALPVAKLSIGAIHQNDPRDYKVNFNLLSELLPNFSLNHDVKQGIEELTKVVSKKMRKQDWDEKRFVRLHQLRKKINLLT